MKFSRFLSVTEILLLVVIAILGLYSDIRPLIKNGLSLAILILALVALLAIFILSMARFSMESFKKVRIDQNAEDYHLYLKN